MEPTTSRYIEVRESKIHNKGVFAARDIPKGTRIIEYVGEIITKAEAEKRVTETTENANEENGAVYIFELNRKHDIDGNVDYNTARFINHSCDPNCETKNISKHIWIIAIKDIKKGEELSYNYGYDIECYDEHPCKCGSENCVGYIVAEEHFPKLRKKLKNHS